MSVSGIASVQVRIADIQSRFGIAASFTSALQSAAAQSGSAPAAQPARAPQPLPATPTSTAAASVPASSDSRVWASRLPAAARPWVGAIEDAATRYRLDPALLAALVQQESAFNPDARSHAGAIGLTQLMPGTAQGLGVDPYDPLQNLDGGARYLREQLDRFGSIPLALAAYNAGPGRVAQAGGIPQITETQDYVRRVVASYESLKA